MSTSTKHKKSKHRASLTSIDIILRTFHQGDSVVVTVNGGAIQGTIVDILLCARSLIVADVSGSYFIPFDNIDYIQTVCTQNPAAQIKQMKKICDLHRPMAGGTAVAH